MDVKLVFFKQNGQRKDFPVSDSTVIGRGENCDLRVPVASVSRRHCELTVGAGAVQVKDMASSNGTYVNNQRVHETELAAGDRLVIGPIVFTVQIDGEPEEILPIKTRGQKMAEEGATEAEEVVDLEADVIARPGAAGVAAGGPLGVADEDEDADVDPISALEALASEQDDEDENR
jgi:pSer/pThr/pTyr-binding forkhead associated (FHA) protein